MNLRRVFMLTIVCLLLGPSLQLTSATQIEPEVGTTNNSYTVYWGEVAQNLGQRLVRTRTYDGLGWNNNNKDVASIDLSGTTFVVTFKSNAEVDVPYDFGFSILEHSEPDQTFHITVTILSSPVVAEDQSFSGPAGQPIVGQLVVSGGAGPITFLPTSPPTNASVTLNYDGALEIVPNEGEYFRVTSSSMRPITSSLGHHSPSPGRL